MTAVVHDWSRDVKKYIPSANEAAITGIVENISGIALQSRDASFVACEDKTEPSDRVRESFLKKAWIDGLRC